MDRLLADSQTPEDLRRRLRLAREIVAFAADDLGLVAGKKYRKYVDLERPYVVWTVVAAPEFSLEPESWCFPVAGCVGYRGYFSRKRAERFAAGLESRGLETSVGGVIAFSSLGWLGDPLLNTFVFADDHRLAGILFHELAHGVVYVKDGTAFNESFATAVERSAVRRWLAGTEPDAGRLAAEYEDELERLDRMHGIIARARGRLQELYGASIEEPEKRKLKRAVFAELRLALAEADPARRTAFGGWSDRELDNADLASVGFYRERLEAFEELLRFLSGDLRHFYAAAACLGRLPHDERDRRLSERDWAGCILPGRTEAE